MQEHGIRYAMIHPEFFITPDGKLNFGEVAGFGDHYGTIYVSGDDAEETLRLMQEYEAEDFYTADAPHAESEKV